MKYTYGFGMDYVRSYASKGYELVKWINEYHMLTRASP